MNFLRNLIGAVAVSLLCSVAVAVPVPVTAVYSFTSPDNNLANVDGLTPQTLVVDDDGDFIGAARLGGPSGHGTLFKLSSTGDFTTLHGFDTATGVTPNGALAEDVDGSFYGSTTNGGPANAGTLFRTTSDGDLVSLYSFTDVSGPNNTNADGRSPLGGLIIIDGDFYGMTNQGGAFGGGVLFKMVTDGTPEGTEVTTLYSFPAGSAAPGRAPGTALFKRSDGTLLGMTNSGGSANSGCLFQVTTDGTPEGTTVATLTTWTADESSFDFGDTFFTETDDGMVYGVRTQGGTNGSGFFFKIGQGNSYTNLYSFPYEFDTGKAGGSPTGALVLDTDGTFLGMASVGGANDGGTIFRLTTDGTAAGTSQTLLYSFSAVDSSTDVNVEGANPVGSLVPTDSGIFYGVAPYGGAYGHGTIFTFDPSAVPTTPPATFSVTNLIVTNTTTPGTPFQFQATSSPGAHLKIQTSKTPGDATSWSDLYDFDEGRMTESSTTPGSYSLDTEAYPDGSGISFRALGVSSNESATASSNVVGPYTLHQAALTVLAHMSSTSDPGNGTVSRVGDSVTLSFTVQNNGSIKAKNLKVVAIVPSYFAINGDHVQFAKTDVTKLSSSGVYLASTTPTNPNAQINWGVGDLDAGSSATVNYVIKLPASVRLDPHQTISTGGYFVSSASTPPIPTYRVSGDSSHSTLFFSSIEGLLDFQLTADSVSVAPGGLFTYHYSMTNFGAVAIAHPVAVINVPASARFDASYATGTKTSVPGVVYAGKKNGPTVKINWLTGGAEQLIVIPTGLKAHGDKNHGDTVAFDVTFQAQWVNPSDIAQIDSGSSRAAFLSTAPYIDTTTGKSTNQWSAFAAALKGLDISRDEPSTTDFYNLIGDTLRGLAVDSNDPASIHVQVQGSTANQPQLAFTKSLANSASDTLNDGLGDTADVVQPGDTATYVFLLANRGKAAAEDVYVQDAMPSRTSYVGGSAKIVSTTASSKASDLDVVQEILGAGSTVHFGPHLIFNGIHLEPNDFVLITYSVKVDSNAPIGSTLTTSSGTDPSTGLLVTSTAGTSSSPRVVGGVTLNGPLEVGGKVSFAQPRIRAMIPKPEISTDMVATQNALNAAYASNPDGKPLTSQSNPLSFIPGMERFYIHYENTSTATVSSVDLQVPLPANTAFYRAKFVTLGTNPQAGADGIWPGKIDKTPPAVLTTPAVLATSGSVSAHFTSLAKGAKGDLVLEVIVLPGAVNTNGSFIGGLTGSSVLIHDNPVAKGSKPAAAMQRTFNQFPHVPVAHHATVTASASVFHRLSPLTPTPTVPEISVLKIAPTVVNAGAAVNYTFIISNSGDSDSPAVNFSFVQPAQTTFTSENHTNLYGAQFVVDAQAAIPGTNLECFWDYIPAHAAVAITYQLTASGAPGTAIMDNDDHAYVPYLGVLRVTPAAMGVLASNNTSSPALGGLTYSITGHSLHSFTVSGSQVLVVDLGAGFMVVDEPASMYQELTFGNSEITSGHMRGTYIGQGAGIGVGATNAGNLVNNRSHGALLKAVDSSPGTLIVPAGCMELALPGQTAAAAGSGLLALPNDAKLITQDGGGLISQDGGGLITQDGGGLITQDGGGLISQDGGGVVSNDGGSLISQDGGGITAQANSSLVAQGGGNLVAQGGGNLVAQGGGN